MDQDVIKNYLVEICSKCGKTMTIEKGTVAYDGKWYHQECWGSGHALEDTSFVTPVDENISSVSRPVPISNTDESIPQDIFHETCFIELFEQLYQNSPDMYRVIDVNGIITLCNKSYAKHLGYSVKEIIGRSIFDHVAKESLFAIHDSFETWKNTGSVKNREVWFQRRDGSTFLGLINANNICDKNGHLIGSNTVIRDITEIYYARKEIEEREAKIRADFHELKKVNLLKDEFLAMVTHELKTPLVPIKCYIDLLLSGQFGSLNDAQKQKLEIVMTSTNSLVGLISDLLDAEKIELGRLKLYKDNHDIGKIIRDVVVKMSPTADCAKVTISTDLKNNVLCVCDSARIEQVFNNIITNAIKFVKPEIGRIQIKLDSDKNNAIIVVKDNGIGITADQLDKVFLKFYQVNTSNIREHGGTGLGLAICKALIESQGGNIWATSDGFEKGTEIHILLPLTITNI